MQTDISKNQSQPVGVSWRFILWKRSGHDCAVIPELRASDNWKALYEAALRETDPAKLADWICVARNAILDRIEESLRNPSPAEHRIMNDALRNLHRLAEVMTSRAAA